MAITSTFQPKSGVTALFDLIYEVKFSRHVPLFVIMLSGIWAVYRSTHYFIAAFHLPPWVALPSALFIELLVLGSGAMVFIAHRAAFVAELRDGDQGIALVGAYGGLVFLAIALAALIGIAWADAWLLTHDVQACIIMTLAQLGQSGMIMNFIITALLDERHSLREQYADLARELKQRQNQECPYCHVLVRASNRARHIRTCAANPANKQP